MQWKHDLLGAEVNVLFRCGSRRACCPNDISLLGTSALETNRDTQRLHVKLIRSEVTETISQSTVPGNTLQYYSGFSSVAYRYHSRIIYRDSAPLDGPQRQQKDNGKWQNYCGYEMKGEGG
jgi:hypothetical protein